VIEHSSLYEEAIRYSNTMSTIVDVYVGDTLVYADIPVVDGNVTCDRGSKVRWSSKIDIALYPWQLVPLLDTYQARFKVYRGLTSLGRTEMLQLGEYRVDEIARSDVGHLQVSGSGLESYLVDARFLRPRTPPTGESTLQAIADLIGEAVPGSPTVVAQSTGDRRVQATAPWERDRIDAVLALGDSLNADVFVNNAGIFVIRDKPTLVGRVPVFLVNAGDGGVLVGEDVKDTRDGVYNAVSVSGQSSDQAVPPVWGWAYDNDTASSTYYYGDFGQKPMFYSSQYIYSDAQCVSIAQTMLIESLAVNSSLSFESLAVCFLEAGDVVTVLLSDGTTANHLLQKTDIGLAHNGTLKADTTVNRSGAGGDA
jgi:hypothetical protein